MIVIPDLAATEKSPKTVTRIDPLAKTREQVTLLNIDTDGNGTIIHTERNNA